MSNIYAVVTLIGIPCVFFGAYVGLKVKIDLINARWSNLRKKASKERQKEYSGKRRLYRRFQKLNTYLLVISMIMSSIHFMNASVSIYDSVVVDSSLTEKIGLTYKNPMDRLAQNTKEKVNEIFKDYLFFAWFEEEKGRTKRKYRENVNQLFEGSEPVSDALEKKPAGEECDAYAAYVDRQREIDQAKVPEGATLEQVQRGEVLPKELTVDEYIEEYDL